MTDFADDRVAATGPSPRRVRSGAEQAIRFILVAQLAMAAALIVGDLSGNVPTRFDLWDTTPRLDAPTSPGDQTRRFDPASLPALPFDPAARPFPQVTDMPDRLQFRPINGGATLAGQIMPGDAARFASWLDGQTSKPETIWLHSPGGSVADALAIGRLIRAAGSNTAIAGGDVCLSACPYVLAGGVERQVDAAAMVGVHQHYFGENSVLPAFLAVEDVQRGQSEVVAYLDEMGIDLRLMRLSLATPPDEIYILTPRELRDYGFVPETEKTH